LGWEGELNERDGRAGSESVSSVTFYGLLYIEPLQRKHVNLNSLHNAIDVYVLCAALCARSADRHNTPFKLITNDPRTIRQRLEHHNLTAIDIVEHEFSLHVPKGIPFFTAHFKIDVLAAFGRGEYGEYTGLVDIDAVFRDKVDLDGLHPGLCIYDITSQVAQVYGTTQMQADLETVAGQKLDTPRWYGGEFIAGPSGTFRDLSDCIADCWPRYLAALDRLHHVGDEMIVSAAINLLRARDVDCRDLGAEEVVARWWSSRTLHDQYPFSKIRKAAFLHLPSDKLFLSRQAISGFLSEDTFMDMYMVYLKKKLLIRRIVNLADMFMGRPKIYTPRI
jgi:hypothetical protein